jgi:hypothetical protein
MKMKLMRENCKCAETVVAPPIGIWDFFLCIVLPLPLVLPLFAGLVFSGGHYFAACFENLHDQNIYFSFIRQARDGFIFFINAPCHIPHEHEYVNFTLLIVGILSRFTGMSMELSYILTGYFFSVAVCLSLCYLFGQIIKDKRLSLLGVFVAWSGGGFGLFFKIFAALSGFSIDEKNMTSMSGDLWMPEMTIWHSAAYSPLFISSYLMIMLVYGGIWVAEKKDAFWPLALSAISAFYLALSHSYDIIPLGMISVFIFVLFRVEKKSLLPSPRLLAGYLLFVFGLLGGTLYQYYVLKHNPGFSLWAAQNINKSPAFHMILAGFGVLSLGYVEAFIMMFKDGKKIDIPMKILIFWLFFQTALLYSPFPFARRFILGIIVPLALLFVFFVARLWMRGGRLPRLCALALLALLPLTFLYQSAANVGKLVKRDPRYFYGREAVEAYRSLSQLGEDDIVMGSLHESNRLMRFCPARMICASTQQSAAGMREAVEQIFAGDKTLQVQNFISNNGVSYIFLDKNVQGGFIEASAEFLSRQEVVFENNSFIIYNIDKRNGNKKL